MKKAIAVLLIFITVGLGIFAAKPVQSYAKNLIYKSQCDNPKTFRIGSIDAKYSITPMEFKNNIAEAAAIWDSFYGKKLFVYDPKGDIEVNLVYDQRQFLSTQINDLNSKVKSKQSELDPKIADYKRRIDEFRTKSEKLNSDIEYWNQRGGAPDDEYNKLIDRQNSLRDEATRLQEEAQMINQSAQDFNQQVGELQQTVDNFNEQLTYKPEEGEYIYNNGEETINIYFDTSKTQLIHTLAHELGHSLQIQHNNNSQSIMYFQSTDSTTLTLEDKNALLKACEKKNVFVEGTKNVVKLIAQIKSTLDR